MTDIATLDAPAPDAAEPAPVGGLSVVSIAKAYDR